MYLPNRATHLILDADIYQVERKEIRGTTAIYEDWGEDIAAEILPDNIKEIICINCVGRPLRLPSAFRNLLAIHDKSFFMAEPYLLPPKHKKQPPYDPASDAILRYTDRRLRLPAHLKKLTLRNYGAATPYSPQELIHLQITLENCPAMEQELSALRRKVERAAAFAVARSRKVPDADNMARIIASYL